MNITLHQLTVLQAVKAHGSITLAAKALHITQPAVSNILKQLEQKYDYALTETIGKKVFLTDAGERLVQAATAISDILESADTDIHAMHGKLSGTMTLTIVSTAKYFLPKLLGEFRKKYPAIKITLNVCNRQEAIDVLKENASDFLIMSQLPKDIAIDKQLFYEDQLIVITPPEMSFQKPVRQLNDLTAADWIIREPGSGTRMVMKKLFKKYKMLPNIAMEVGNNETIKQLIMANMGISIVSKQSVELELEHGLVKTLPIEEFPLQHAWYLVRNKGKFVSPVARAFLEFVRHYDVFL